MKNDYPQNDNQYEEVKVKDVSGNATDGYGITRDDGWSFYVPKDSKIKPEVGMLARFYGKGIGYTVRGLFLDGQKVFYKTDAEEKIEHQKWCDDENRKKKDDYENNKADYDLRYDKLPLVFRQRLDKFRNTNPDFRWKYEPYELFCIEQAVIFAEHFKTPLVLKQWKELDYKSQKKALPELSDDHSGNTFSCAYGLAHTYLTNPELVVKMHGALTTLVGCEEYGCPHPKINEKGEK
ncbi:MAG: hypothetical protein WC389_13840 [Lutibacter sp.]|jgi:hypothetical protein